MSKYDSMSREELEQAAADAKWFHAIDFGNFQSSGRMPEGSKPNYTLFPVFEILKRIDLKGMDCLDVGSACGLTSFGLKTSGAKYVASVDIVDFYTYRIAQNLLGLDTDYHPRVRADRMSDEFPDQRFDLIVCAGVLYHMFNPMGAIAEARRLIRKNGLFVLETAYIREPAEPIMMFNSENAGFFDEAYTYWLPTESAIAGMLKMFGFNILRVVKLASPARIAFLVQAVDYNDVENRTPIMKRAQELGFGEQAYRLECYPKEVSKIKFNPDFKNATVDIATFESDFPHHVARVSRNAGSSLYNKKQHNFDD